MNPKIKLKCLVILFAYVPNGVISVFTELLGNVIAYGCVI
jgi:hypothetical protein